MLDGCQLILGWGQARQQCVAVVDLAERRLDAIKLGAQARPSRQEPLAMSTQLGALGVGGADQAKRGCRRRGDHSVDLYSVGWARDH
jgi:hypothetical protein